MQELQAWLHLKLGGLVQVPQQNGHATKNHGRQRLQDLVVEDWVELVTRQKEELRNHAYDIQIYANPPHALAQAESAELKSRKFPLFAAARCSSGRVTLTFLDLGIHNVPVHAEPSSVPPSRQAGRRR